MDCKLRHRMLKPLGRWGAFTLITVSALTPALAATTVETLSYHDNESKWILGQVAARSVNGILSDQTSFDPTNARPLQFWSFGKFTQAIGYNADGTIASLRDGNGNTITLGSWKRGIPQAIGFPDTTSLTATVDDRGWISQVTDQNGYTTAYRFDAMGRLAGTDYPSADATAWNAMNQSFTQVAGDEYGIAAGHWRRTTTVGNRTSVTYYDALWRPLVGVEYDSLDPSTARFSGNEYDNEGRAVFAAYPATTANADRGTWTTYDVLGRAVSVVQDSELGPLTTTTRYLSDASGVFTLVSNPRGAETRTWYQMLDTPSFERPVRILQPEGAVTTIPRDAFGKPLSITRGNADGSLKVTRSYTYNNNQELCRTVEPETGATLTGYDGAGNVAWSAGGLPGTTNCEPDGGSPAVAARRAVRSYDTRNRPRTLSFPDGNGDQSWTYTPDGKVGQITTRNDGGGSQVVNNYAYNKRRLLTSESIEQTGFASQSVGYLYDSNASLAGVQYPSGLTLDYGPNALGQPTHVSAFATAVTYYPNGGMKRFVYGNGIVHTMQQNGRQLPAQVADGGILNNGYSYDAAGNVTQITDGLNPQRTRSMSYDTADRLLTANSPAFGGNGQMAYTYDVLDNIRTAALGAVRNHSYWYDASNRLSNVLDGTGSTVMGFAFDAQGNLANKNGQGFQFDYGNRLRTVVGKDNYRYDGNGRRVLSSSATGPITALYGQDGALRRQDNDRNASSTEYVYLNGSLLAEVATSTAPGAPVITAPAQSSNGNFVVSWTETAQASRYELQEQAGGGAMSNVYSGPDRLQNITGRSGGSYGYRVRACRNTVCGEWSATAPVVVKSSPSSGPAISAPGLSLDGTYTVAWQSVSGASNYRLEESAGGGAWTEIQNGATLARSFSSKPDGTYGYRARACNEAGCGVYGNASTVQVLRLPSTAPTASAPALSANGVYSVTWTSVAGASSYRLEESIGGSGWIIVYSGASTSAAHSQKADGSYSYRASACNSSGCGPSGGIATTRVVRPPTGATTVSGPALSNDGNIALSWPPVSAATYYTVYENVGGAGWAAVLTTGSTSAILSGRVNATIYYGAAACNDGGCGAQGPSLAVVVMRPPGAPAISLPGSSATGSYTVAWGNVDRASSYLIEESATGGAWTALQNNASTSIGLARGDGTYAYRVAACNQGGCSGYSANASITVNVPPATPTGLTARYIVTNAFPPWQVRYTVSWNPVPGAAWYEVTGRGTYSGAATSAVINYSGVPSGATFQVRACKSIGCSAWSAIVTATGG